jgi:hypothetical protein
MASESLQQKVAAWTWRNGGNQAVKEIARGGPEGTRLLAEEMRRRSQWSERLYIAAALGYGSGDSGIEELRSAAKETGPHTQDLRCASLLALSKRVGEGATGDFVEALSDKTGAVRHFAMFCLAAVGNGSAWDAVLARLRTWLKKRSSGSDELSAVTYLLRTTRLEGISALRDLLREAQGGIELNLSSTLLQIWPDVLSTEPISEGDVGRWRSSAWSWFAEGHGHLFESKLPTTVVTYS